MRTFAIGDIHGSHKELVELLKFIFNGEDFEKGVDRLLFIGDYVDRGPGSAQVIKTLIGLKKAYPNTVFLRGNHEDMFLSYLGVGGSYGGVFIMNGGGTTLLSYVFKTLPAHRDLSDAEYHTQMRTILDEFKLPSFEVIAQTIPQSHINFLKDTQRYFDTDNVTFVHAAVNPKLELDKQTDFTLFWADDNRDGFFSRIRNNPWKKMLVHGHTPMPPDEVKKHIDKNRINIDTGFVYGGHLTCLVVDEGVSPENWKVIQHEGDKISWKV